MQARAIGRKIASQSLWVRDRFLIDDENGYSYGYIVAIPLGQGQIFNSAGLLIMLIFRSQSLWVRDRFLIFSLSQSKRETNVAIPLGQGQVFNSSARPRSKSRTVAIPLGQGQVFNNKPAKKDTCFGQSQSLWVRDRFLIKRPTGSQRNTQSRNPFGSGTGF